MKCTPVSHGGRIVFQFVIIVVLLLFYVFDLIDYYRSFLVGFISICFVYNTNSATNAVYGLGPKKATASAGVILLLSIVNFTWLFYFGGDNASPVNKWVNSFSLNGIKPSPLEHSRLSTRRRISNMITNNFETNNINAYSDNMRFASYN